ncbi:MAG: hypothetical protein R3D71_07010 [Rickettsiales bacterium]
MMDNTVTQFDIAKNDFIQQQVKIINLLEKHSLHEESKIFADFTDDLIDKTIKYNNHNSSKTGQKELILSAKIKLNYSVHNAIEEELKLGVNPAVKRRINNIIHSFISLSKLDANQLISAKYEITQEDKERAKNFYDTIRLEKTNIPSNSLLSDRTKTKFSNAEKEFTKKFSELARTLAKNTDCVSYTGEEIAIIHDASDKFIRSIKNHVTAFSGTNNIERLKYIYTLNTDKLVAASQQMKKIHNEIKSIITNPSLNNEQKKKAVNNKAKEYENKLNDMTEKINKLTKFINNRNQSIER